MSVHWPIIRRLLASPHRVVVVDDQRHWRAVELLVLALHLASEIERRCESRTVGVLLPTGGLFPAAALAGWMTGRVVVPLNYLLKPEELQYVIDDCETDLVLTVGPMLEFLGAAPRCKHVVDLAAMNFKAVPELRWPAPADDSDLAVMLYTSGTSGKPKGVMLSHGNITSNILQVQDHVHFTRRDIVLGVLPQFHSFGLTVLTILPLAAGMKVVYSARFTPSKIVKLIREHRPTITIAIPSMYNALLATKDADAEDFASLRYTVSGGEPLPQAVFDRFKERFGITINEGYGLTETSPVSNWCRPEEFRRGSVGRPLPRIDQRIINPATGEALGPNQDGEVIMRGPNIMQGYYKLPEETARALDADGFLHTGDQGRFDNDGHLYITGRIKEMIIVGGENVFPREIEEVLNQHPTVQATGVIGVRDDVRGELPWAFVELKEDAEFNESALRQWCRERLAGYKAPREIVRVDTLPRNPTGKIMRRELVKFVPAGEPAAGLQ